MSTTLRHITGLVTAAAALSIWTAPMAAADFTVDGPSCHEVTDAGDCLSPAHSSNFAPEIPMNPREPYLDTLRVA